MRVKIEHIEIQTGWLFRRTFHEVHLTTDFTHEEKQIVRQRYLGDHVLLERWPAGASDDDDHDRYALRVDHLFERRPDKHRCAKTQTLQFHIARDLEDVARGDKSVVVIDSQGDLINTILAARTLPPEKIVLIDPEDIEWPVCLNLFSVGQDRLAGYDALERERLTNSIIELYDFVLGSLLSAGMTQKQSVVFRYVTRLMFHIDPAPAQRNLRHLYPGPDRPGDPGPVSVLRPREPAARQPRRAG